ncbi:uncharacterized protein MONBRDRAFT_28729 [Monosiga brevicollis MX1]|uniref:Non-specific protein-tyrosine kinase n=1 Tax=Monosiga brevicollis TaxID=81824 RepID=A9V908_MONBE|nr:uncharacterized protein MONBRDRAFT_28729 [Monosiga brevicollis MX1]EDQ85972.1 predicted protein [Monosiga brevicollis MX1]|eukprot:XP_001749166.1 hypothetical protein [Monosiga brevicollis MX1]
MPSLNAPRWAHPLLLLLGLALIEPWAELGVAGTCLESIGPHGLTWPATSSGRATTLPCPSPHTGSASRSCCASAQQATTLCLLQAWSEPSYAQCAIPSLEGWSSDWATGAPTSAAARRQRLAGAATIVASSALPLGSTDVTEILRLVQRASTAIDASAAANLTIADLETHLDLFDALLQADWKIPDPDAGSTQMAQVYVQLAHALFLAPNTALASPEPWAWHAAAVQAALLMGPAPELMTTGDHFVLSWAPNATLAIDNAKTFDMTVLTQWTLAATENGTTPTPSSTTSKALTEESMQLALCLAAYLPASNPNGRHHIFPTVLFDANQPGGLTAGPVDVQYNVASLWGPLQRQDQAHQALLRLILSIDPPTHGLALDLVDLQMSAIQTTNNTQIINLTLAVNGTTVLAVPAQAKCEADVACTLDINLSAGLWTCHCQLQPSSVALTLTTTAPVANTAPARAYNRIDHALAGLLLLAILLCLILIVMVGCQPARWPLKLYRLGFMLATCLSLVAGLALLRATDLDSATVANVAPSVLMGAQYAQVLHMLALASLVVYWTPRQSTYQRHGSWLRRGLVVCLLWMVPAAVVVGLRQLDANAFGFAWLPVHSLASQVHWYILGSVVGLVLLVLIVAFCRTTTPLGHFLRLWLSLVVPLTAGVGGSLLYLLPDLHRDLPALRLVYGILALMVPALSTPPPEDESAYAMHMQERASSKASSIGINPVMGPHTSVTRLGTRPSGYSEPESQGLVSHGPPLLVGRGIMPRSSFSSNSTLAVVEEAEGEEATLSRRLRSFRHRSIRQKKQADPVARPRSTSLGNPKTISAALRLEHTAQDFLQTSIVVQANRDLRGTRKGVAAIRATSPMRGSGRRHTVAGARQAGSLKRATATAKAADEGYADLKTLRAVTERLSYVPRRGQALSRTGRKGHSQSHASLFSNDSSAASDSDGYMSVTRQSSVAGSAARLPRHRRLSALTAHLSRGNSYMSFGGTDVSDLEGGYDQMGNQTGDEDEANDGLATPPPALPDRASLQENDPYALAQIDPTDNDALEGLTKPPIPAHVVGAGPLLFRPTTPPDGAKRTVSRMSNMTASLRSANLPQQRELARMQAAVSPVSSSINDDSDGIEYETPGVLRGLSHKDSVRNAHDMRRVRDRAADVQLQQLRRASSSMLNGSNVKFLDDLGRGEFGVVRRARLRRGSQEDLVAVKLLKHSASVEQEIAFLEEATIMTYFSHQNVLRLVDTVTNERPIMLVLELMEQGSLQRVLRHETMEDIRKLKYSYDILNGLQYIHEEGFIHRDLAARNVLLGQGLAKIADFGFCRRLKRDQSVYVELTGQLPVRWCSPEALNYGHYSKASDVWAAAVTLHEMWTGARLPYKGWSNLAVATNVGVGHRLPPIRHMPRPLYDLLVRCWHPNLRERPTARAMLDKVGMIRRSPELVGDRFETGVDPLQHIYRTTLVAGQPMAMQWVIQDTAARDTRPLEKMLDDNIPKSGASDASIFERDTLERAPPSQRPELQGAAYPDAGGSPLDPRTKPRRASPLGRTGSAQSDVFVSGGADSRCGSPTMTRTTPPPGARPGNQPKRRSRLSDTPLSGIHML